MLEWLEYKSIQTYTFQIEQNNSINLPCVSDSLLEVHLPHYWQNPPNITYPPRAKGHGNKMRYLNLCPSSGAREIFLEHSLNTNDLCLIFISYTIPTLFRGLQANVDYTISGHGTAISTLDHSATTPTAWYLGSSINTNDKILNKTYPAKNVVCPPHKWNIQLNHTTITYYHIAMN